MKNEQLAIKAEPYLSAPRLAKAYKHLANRPDPQGKEARYVLDIIENATIFALGDMSGAMSFNHKGDYQFIDEETNSLLLPTNPCMFGYEVDGFHWAFFFKYANSEKSSVHVFSMTAAFTKPIFEDIEFLGTVDLINGDVSIRPSLIEKRKGPLPSDGIMALIAGALLAWDLVIAYPSEERKLPITRRRVSGKVGKGWSGIKYYVRTIDTEAYIKAASRGGTRKSPAFHLRRAHLRELPSGKIIQIAETWVGDPSTGIVIKDYVVKDRGRFMALSKDFQYRSHLH